MTGVQLPPQAGDRSRSDELPPRARRGGIGIGSWWRRSARVHRVAMIVVALGVAVLLGVVAALSLARAVRTTTDTAGADALTAVDDLTGPAGLDGATASDLAPALGPWDDGALVPPRRPDDAGSSAAGRSPQQPDRSSTERADDPTDAGTVIDSDAAADLDADGETSPGIDEGDAGDDAADGVDVVDQGEAGDEAWEEGEECCVHTEIDIESLPVVSVPRFEFDAVGRTYVRHDALPGQVLHVWTDDPDTAGFTIQLFRDDGALVASADQEGPDATSRRFSRGGSDELWYRFDQQRRYMLAVDVGPQRTIPFVTEVLEPADQPRTVVDVTARYPLDAGSVRFDFDGRGGQLATVSASSPEAAIGLDVRLYDPDGALLHRDYGIPLLAPTCVTTPLTYAGEHTVEVVAYQGWASWHDGPHEYHLTVQLLDLG